MMQANLLSLREQLLIFQQHYKGLLPSVVSERISMNGPDGDMSLMELIDILMPWYVTLSPRAKVKFWTMNLDFLMLGTYVGTPSRSRN